MSANTTLSCPHVRRVGFHRCQLETFVGMGHGSIFTMYEDHDQHTVLRRGSAPGGLNFDAKVRREYKFGDCTWRWYGCIRSGISAAAKIIEDGVLEQWYRIDIQVSTVIWDGFESTTILKQRPTQIGEPEGSSARVYENIFAEYIR